MVRPLYKRAVKGARNRTGTSKKRTKEEIHVTMFKQVQFSILFSKRMAKPYPDGPVDQRDSFRVNLCDNFILDIAFSS